jgi:hypothetical protein
VNFNYCTSVILIPLLSTDLTLQKLTLEILRKPTYLVKVPFFPLIPFHLKKKKNFFFLILQNRTIGFELKRL